MAKEDGTYMMYLIVCGIMSSCWGSSKRYLWRKWRSQITN